MNKRKGRIFVISAPSGSGKTTVCRDILKRVKNIVPSVSVTTRHPRKGEKNKKDYFYISEKSFKEKIRRDGFLEWEENFGHLYGTPKQFVKNKLKDNKDVLLSIDVKGAMRIKEKYPEKSVLIFLKPPSIKELTRRLKSRDTDEKKEIDRRLKIARKELSYFPRYDYVVVNDKLEKAVDKIISIIAKERS